MELKAIGKVDCSKGTKIVLEDKYIRGLKELEGFSHVQVFWWCDNGGMERIVEEKPYVKGPEEIGVFATRSPLRPNPIALTTVPLLAIEGGVLIIPWIDADHGTKVLDIKPYHPATERVKEVRVPTWCSHWPSWYEESGSFNWEEEFSFS